MAWRCERGPCPAASSPMESLILPQLKQLSDPSETLSPGQGGPLFPATLTVPPPDLGTSTSAQPRSPRPRGRPRGRAELLGAGCSPSPHGGCRFGWCQASGTAPGGCWGLWGGHRWDRGCQQWWLRSMPGRQGAIAAITLASSSAKHHGSR